MAVASSFTYSAGSAAVWIISCNRISKCFPLFRRQFHAGYYAVKLEKFIHLEVFPLFQEIISLLAITPSNLKNLLISNVGLVEVFKKPSTI
jgi:hypothetical protein